MDSYRHPIKRKHVIATGLGVVFIAFVAITIMNMRKTADEQAKQQLDDSELLKETDTLLTQI
jgi:hypothetical protein